MVEITAELRSGTQVELSNERHDWVADEPKSLKGTDRGPNPYEYLLGSLASCTCITLSLYCQHKGIEFRYITVKYKHDRVHAKDCEDCDRKDGGYIDKITSDVIIVGDFDQAQRKRLTEIAERCPVHKTLANGVDITDNVSFE